MRHKRDVSAGVIVFHEGEKRQYLLLLSRLTKRPIWEFPKGGVDPGESLLDTALRELREESGLAGLDIRLVPGFQRSERYRFTAGKESCRTIVHKEVTYFLARAFRTDVRVSVEESLEFAWFDLETAIRRIRYAARRQLLREADAAAEALAGAGAGAEAPPAGSAATATSNVASASDPA